MNVAEVMAKIGTDSKKVAKEGQKLNVINRYRRQGGQEKRDGFVYIFAEHDPNPWTDSKTPNITRWIDARDVPFTDDNWYFDSDGQGGLQANARPISEFDKLVLSKKAELQALRDAGFELDVTKLIS